MHSCIEICNTFWTCIFKVETFGRGEHVLIYGTSVIHGVASVPPPLPIDMSLWLLIPCQVCPVSWLISPSFWSFTIDPYYWSFPFSVPCRGMGREHWVHETQYVRLKDGRDTHIQQSVGRRNVWLYPWDSYPARIRSVHAIASRRVMQQHSLAGPCVQWVAGQGS
jgi:hypothetical protein